MKLTGLVVVVLVIALALFALLNWSQVAAPTTLSVGFTTFHAPLGLMLLAGSGLLTATFLVFVTYQQAAALLESRRFARDLHQHRQVADEAEASRFTELRAYLEGALRGLDDKLTASGAELGARIDRVQETLVARLAEDVNGVSAHLAEVEDKLDRALRGQRPGE